LNVTQKYVRDIRNILYIWDRYGYTDAIDLYYTYLDYRNDDMRYILRSSQYVRFMASPYFYSPIYSTGRDWAFRIYTIYSNRSFFYYDAPSIYKKYRGAHSRKMYTGGYYINRYQNHDFYKGDYRVTGSQHFNDRRRTDFGVNLKPRTGKTYNNYKNPNSENRTSDSRYRDNSGNTHSPMINNRSSRSTSSASSTSSRGNRSSSTTQSSSSTSTRQTTTSSGTVRSGRR